jgi:hypothetical protein
MKKPLSTVLCILVSLTLAPVVASAASPEVRLFDGKTLAGWQGDTETTWRVDEGAIIGGSLTTRIPRNEFLTSSRRATNFVLRLEFKLVGTEGFINAGVQIRSERATDPANEMIGYQADIGEGWWGALYDESRRNKPLAKPDPAAVEKAIRRGDWNAYLIRCEGPRIRTWINGTPMIDYTESDAGIPQHGLIGLQIHGGAKAEVSYRKITLQHLPSDP